MISTVEMLNWRAFDDRRIELQPGVNFLLGANGAGKTSVLEAIVYGLTGAASTVQDKGKLLRDPHRPAEVAVTFEASGEWYRVERSQGLTRVGDAVLVRAADGARLARTHKGVTTEIERLLGASADFLRRIVYMAEGDVFGFLSDPPGQALDLQVRQVLGLTQLNEFMVAVQAAEKQLKGDLKRLQDCFTRLEKWGAGSGDDLEDRLAGFDGERDILWSDLVSVREQLGALERENEGVARLAPALSRVWAVLGSGASDTAAGESLSGLSAELERRQTAAQAHVEELRLAQARLEGELVGYDRVLNLLEPYAQRPDAAPCPVCHRPLTPAERESVLGDIHAAVTALGAQRRQLDARMEAAGLLWAAAGERLAVVRDLQRALDQAGIRSASPDPSLAEIDRIVAGQQTVFEHSRANLQRSADALQTQLSTLDAERAGALAVQRELQGLGFASLDDARAAWVEVETRSLSLRAVDRAAQDTLARQRDANIEPLYQRLAHVWEHISRDRGWTVRLDATGRPALRGKDGRELDLAQLSGGEKTALLVVLHTLIAQYFAHSDFLLIDEPLEHLDPVNRRSLVRFLVGAGRRHYVRQAIVATFEESLVRPYLGADGVTAIHI